MAKTSTNLMTTRGRLECLHKTQDWVMWTIPKHPCTSSGMLLDDQWMQTYLF